MSKINLNKQIEIMKIFKMIPPEDNIFRFFWLCQIIVVSCSMFN